MVRDAFVRIGNQLERGAQVHEADDYVTLLERLAAAAADLLVVELNIPGMNGINGLHELREQFPTLAIVVA